MIKIKIQLYWYLIISYILYNVKINLLFMLIILKSYNIIKIKVLLIFFIDINIKMLMSNVHFKSSLVPVLNILHTK